MNTQSTVRAPTFAEPVVKAVGGKRQLLHEILPRLPAKIETYYEPFVGGGAVFFALANTGRFRRAVLSDANLGLVNLYIQIRDNCSAVLSHLRTHESKNSREYFYEQRDRSISVGAAGAARYVYLNRTCFNGMHRVNKDGQFNVPFGDYASPRIVDPDGLRAASRVLQGVRVAHCDFEKTVARAGVGDVVYFDSPYLPATESANFTAYTSEGFSVADHERLADCVASVVKRGANVLLSNSDTPESRRIFTRGGWYVESVQARRNINSDASKRGAVGELLVSAPKRRSRVVT